jgi:hypothetical protein
MLVTRALGAEPTSFFLDDGQATPDATTMLVARQRYAEVLLHRCLQLAVVCPPEDTARVAGIGSVLRVWSAFIQHYRRRSTPFVDDDSILSESLVSCCCFRKSMH